MIIPKQTTVVLLALLCAKFTASVDGRTPFSPTSAVVSIRGGDSDGDGASSPGPEDSTESIDPMIETSVIENPVVAAEAVVTPEPVLATIPTPTEEKTVNPKLANAIERTGPALVMLGAIYFLLKYTGENGLLFGLIPLMQLGMYSETTGIIEEFHQAGKRDLEVKLEKWWWFATTFAATTLRGLGGVGKVDGSALDLICFGMVAIGLVVAVVGMASHQAAGPEIFRKYLGEVAAFHFALVSEILLC